MQSDELNVNLMDPADIRAKIPLAMEILEVKIKAMEQAQQDTQRWAQLVSYLKALAEEKPTTIREQITSNGAVTKEEAAVRVVREIGRPMRPPEVFHLLRQRGVEVASQNAANALLHSAWKKGRLVKAGKGLYAPKEWDQEGVIFPER